MKKSKLLKTVMLLGSQACLLFSGGTCLPDNIFSNTAGEIVNGLIIAGFNILTTGTGFQI